MPIFCGADDVVALESNDDKNLRVRSEYCGGVGREVEEVLSEGVFKFKSESLLSRFVSSLNAQLFVPNLTVNIPWCGIESVALAIFRTHNQ